MIGLEEVRGKYLYPYLLYTYVRFLALGKCAGFPLVLQVQTHSACNGRCLACPYGTVSKRLDQGTMEWSLFERIAQQAVSEPFLQAIVLMLQNEPLLDKRVFDCVKYIKSTGRGKFCAIVTNGAQLDAFSPTDMVQSGLDLLVISLDAHSRETYERLHSGLSYDRVIKNISSVLSNESLRQRVCLSFLRTRHNLDEVRVATRYWNSQACFKRVGTPHARSRNGDWVCAPIQSNEHPIQWRLHRVLSRLEQKRGCRERGNDSFEGYLEFPADESNQKTNTGEAVRPDRCLQRMLPGKMTSHSRSTVPTMPPPRNQACLQLPPRSAAPRLSIAHPGKDRAAS